MKDKMTIHPRVDDRMRTVRATNDNSEMWVGVGSLIVLVAISVITWWVVRDVLRDAANIKNDWATVAAIVFALAVFSFVGRYVLLIVNGDFAAVREIDQVERTERQRVRAASNAAMAAIELEADKERNRHTEAIRADDTERLRISTAQDFERVHHRIAMLEELSSRGQLIEKTAAPSFVAARERPAIAAARKWAENLYGVDGSPDPDFVHGKGALKRGVPWSKKKGEWNGNSWMATAEHILTTEQAGFPPLIIPIMSDGNVRGYALNIENYPTSTELLRLMDYIINAP